MSAEWSRKYDYFIARLFDRHPVFSVKHPKRNGSIFLTILFVCSVLSIIYYGTRQNSNTYIGGYVADNSVPVSVRPLVQTWTSTINDATHFPSPVKLFSSSHALSSTAGFSKASDCEMRNVQLFSDAAPLSYYYLNDVDQGRCFHVYKAQVFTTLGYVSLDATLISTINQPYGCPRFNQSASVPVEAYVLPEMRNRCSVYIGNSSTPIMEFDHGDCLTYRRSILDIWRQMTEGFKNQLMHECENEFRKLKFLNTTETGYSFLEILALSFAVINVVFSVLRFMFKAMEGDKIQSKTDDVIESSTNPESRENDSDLSTSLVPSNENNANGDQVQVQIYR